MPAILSSWNIVYQLFHSDHGSLISPDVYTRQTIHHHSGVLFECCFCDDIAFEGEKLTIQKAKTFVYLSLFFFFARMHVGGKIYHLAIHIINNVPV